MPEDTTTQKEVKPIIAGKFNGAMSRFQLGAYNDLLWCKVPQAIAHKMATDFGSDLGRLMATDAEFAAKVSKADKYGNSKLSISGGAKIATSRTMSIVRLSQQIYNLYKEGLLANKELPQLSQVLQEYYEESEAWAAEQLWAE